MAKTKVLSAEKVDAFPFINLPDGDYPGVWSGYVVRVEIEWGAPGRIARLRLATADGVRGLNVPCVVRVRGDEVTVEAK